ncbi:MAG: P-II family nitrogen regulator [Dehalococcoidales bacterium]
MSGRDRQKEITLQWRTGEYRVDLLPKLKLEIICHDSEYLQAIDAIRRAAKTDRIDDGKIFVLPVEGAIRIRTGEDDTDVN